MTAQPILDLPGTPHFFRVRRSRLRALGARLTQLWTLEQAARRLDREASSHADCEGCPVCDVRAALRALDRC